MGAVGDQGAIANEGYGSIAIAVVWFGFEELMIDPGFATIFRNRDGKRCSNRWLMPAMRFGLAVMVVPDDKQVVGIRNASNGGGSFRTE